MAKTKITKGEAVLKAVMRGPKKGLTAVTISERTGVGLATTRSYLSALASEGYITVVGQITTGKRGRPALLYGKA